MGTAQAQSATELGGECIDDRGRAVAPPEEGVRGEASPYGWTSKNHVGPNMCVLSLSWNFFVSHDKYQTLQIPYALQ